MVRGLAGMVLPRPVPSTTCSMLCCDTLLSRVLLSYPYGSDLLLLPDHLRLRQIRLLIDWLHASAAVSPFGSAIVKESDLESLLPRQGKRDKAVLEYVTRVAQETLRTALLDERAALLEVVEYLEGLLEAEADLQV
ncbi:hypothetical protein Vretifemale_16717 [Volvox reticuliferus]|uniref:Uncharacterized protein n=1 Tax=Volvox reticuliferus TaxID=1737510 RepID=A0A8J4CZZ3_9CHLO|nr:hypothetical protein Vretifemale_16717 [Volvox reticuliferus]